MMTRVHKKWFHLVICATFWSRISMSSGCKEMDFKIRKDGYALANHTFLTDKALSEGHCESKCFMNDSCISYNFGRGATGELYTCELNEADHKQFPDDLVLRPDTTYKMAENTCNCTDNQVCRMDFVNKKHCCDCRYSRRTMPNCDTKYTVRNCKSFHIYCGEMILDGSDHGQKGICRSFLKTAASHVQPYRLVVDMFSYNNDATIRMHPGIMFNAKSANNYDFVYFRTHAEPNCVSHSVTVTQAGRVEKGYITTKIPSTCSNYVPPVDKWFKVEIQVHPRSVKIFLDGQYAVTYDGTADTLIQRGGLMVYNRYSTVVKFRNYIIGNL